MGGRKEHKNKGRITRPFRFQYKKLMECLASEKPLYDWSRKMITSINSSSLTSVLNSILRSASLWAGMI